VFSSNGILGGGERLAHVKNPGSRTGPGPSLKERNNLTAPGTLFDQGIGGAWARRQGQVPTTGGVVGEVCLPEGYSGRMGLGEVGAICCLAGISFGNLIAWG